MALTYKEFFARVSNHWLTDESQCKAVYYQPVVSQEAPEDALKVLEQQWPDKTVKLQQLGPVYWIEVMPLDIREGWRAAKNGAELFKLAESDTEAAKEVDSFSVREGVLVHSV